MTLDYALELVAAVRDEYARARASASTPQNEHLPEEIEEGNVEYKLKLNDPAPGALA